MKQRHLIEVISVAALFVLTLTIVTQRYVSALQTVQETNDAIIVAGMKQQQMQLEQAQLAIDVLISENKAVALKVKEETEKRLATELARKADAAKAQQQIAELEESLQSKAPDLATIIKEWRPRIAAVKCEWFNGKTKAVSSGSGVLFRDGDEYSVITNRHVVYVKEYAPENCQLKFPDDDKTYKVEPNAIGYAQDQDFASISFTSTSGYARTIAASAANRCSDNAVSGDTIVILGYPSIGSKTDITATEGIVSGYDKPHYITSAKVERGNSGGAAILANKNCYLGIPTFVGVGQIEALARILDQETLIF